jgi:hypothetical protein
VRTVRASPVFACRLARRLEDLLGKTWTSLKKTLYLSMRASGISTLSIGPFGGGIGLSVIRGRAFRLVAFLHSLCGGEVSDWFDELPVESPLILWGVSARFVSRGTGLSDPLILPPAPARRANIPPMDRHRLSFGLSSPSIITPVVFALTGCLGLNRLSSRFLDGVVRESDRWDVKKTLSLGLPIATPIPRSDELTCFVRSIGGLATREFAVEGRRSGVGNANVSFAVLISIGDPVLNMAAQSFFPAVSPAVFGRTRFKVELDGLLRIARLAVCESKLGSTGLSNQEVIGLLGLGVNMLDGLFALVGAFFSESWAFFLFSELKSFIDLERLRSFAMSGDAVRSELR